MGQVYRLPYREPTAREVALELNDKQMIADLNAEQRRIVIRYWVERALTVLFFANGSALIVAAFLNDLRAALLFAIGMTAAALTRLAMELRS